MGIPIYSGWKGTMLPYPESKLTLIVGKPIQFPIISDPTNEDIAKYQEEFIKAMANLFEKHKAKYGQPGDTLEIL